MAAGKSTVAQALAERLPRAAHVRGDLFRRMIVSGRVDYEPAAEEAQGGEGEAQLRLRYRLPAGGGDGDAYAQAGFTAVVEDVVLGADLAAYVRLVRTRPLYVVVLAPSAAAVATREAGRAKTGYGTGQGAWRVEELDGVLRAETPRIRLWVDSSELTVGGDRGGDSDGAGTREGGLSVLPM